MDVRIIDYIEDSHRTLDWYVAQIERRPYRWGYDYLPHDGRTRNFQTGKSTTELTASEFSDYLHRVQSDAAGIGYAVAEVAFAAA